MDPKYPNHPYKGEIDKRLDNGDSARSIFKWLATFNDPQISLSLPTLTKIRRRRMTDAPKLSANMATKAIKSVELDKKIKKLWETVKMCDDLEKRMSPKITVTSIKDWQYINQQKQEALKLIAELQGEKHGEGDISIVLTKIFAKIEQTTDDKSSEEATIDTVLGALTENRPQIGENADKSESV